MLDNIIHFSIKNKLVIGLLTLALVAWGSWSLTHLPIDAVPDITNNQVQIITPAPSQAALDIERLVTFPIEQSVATIPNLVEVRSFSRFGLSVVTVVFKDEVDVYWARQQVAERLAQVKDNIPSGVGTPEMAPVTTGLGEIFQYVLHTKPGFEDKYSAMDLRTIQDWIVRRQLLGVPGVADVSSFGGFLKQYEISLNPDRLRAMNLSIADIFTALEKNNQNTGGAYIDKKPNAWFVRSEGLITSLADIENIVVKSDAGSVPILVRDVATVQFGHAIRYGAMIRNTEGEHVGAVLFMLKGANSSQVIANVKQRVAQIEKTLPEGVMIEPFLDRTKLVKSAISTVTTNLMEGALIVILVLVLILGNLRAGLLVASVIPLAMLFAIGMMTAFGVSGNLMSLGAIDFGLIVDGAVIIVEATMHFLGLKHLDRRLTQPEMDDAVAASSKKMMTSAAFGQIIILIVYLPILALVGIEGKMFKPMAQTVSFAILGAFLLSLTYVPMMSALVLSKKTAHKVNFSDRMMAFFQRLYEPAIRFSLQWKRSIVAAALGILVLSILLFQSLGAEFLPAIDEGDFAVETRVLTGSSLTETVDAATKGAGVLLKNFPDEVKEVVGKIGSSEIPTDPMPMEAADMMVILNDKKDWKKAKTSDELAVKMANVLQEIPGVTFGFQQPIQMRFNELMTGARQDVVIKIYGEDLDSLTQYAVQVGKIANGIEGAKDLYVEEVTGMSQIVVQFNRAQIARFGLNIEDVNTVINTAFAGQSAGLVFEGEKRFDLVVRLEQNKRQGLTDLQNLFITTSGGQQIPLSQVANVAFKVGPNQIQRDDAKRRITIGFNVRGRDVESMVLELKSKIGQQIKFAPGYYPTFGGTFENLQQARARLSVAVPVSLLLIFVLLFFAFGSLKQGLLIFTAIPLSAIGGIVALWLRDMPFSISAGIGFIALFGVAVLNGIVLIAEFNRLKNSGLHDLTEIVLRGTRIRLRPVLLTATVASLGFLPMAISAGSGAEVQRPLATVVIGGLLSATALTLLVLPCLYVLFENMRRKRRKAPISTAIVLLCMLALPISISAQNLPMTLDVAIETAVKNNPGLAATVAQTEYFKLLRGSVKELPKADISLTIGQYNSFEWGDNNLAVSQIFPSRKVFKARAALANEQIKTAETKTAISRNELVWNVKQAFYQLLYQREVGALLGQQDSLYADLARAAALRYRAGEGTFLEKSSAETRLAESRNALRRNVAEQSVLSARLQMLLVSPLPVEVVAQPLAVLGFVPLADSLATKTHPTQAFFKQQISLAERQRDLTATELRPDYSVGYFNQSLIGTPRSSAVDAQNAKVWNRFQGVSIGVAVPWSRKPLRAKIQADIKLRDIATLNLQNNALQLRGEYQQAVQELAQRQTSLDFYQKTGLPNAALVANQSATAYRKGEIGYLEHLLNLQQAAALREGYLQTLNEYNQTVIYLQYLAGQ